MNQREFWDKTYREFGPTMLGICRRYIPDRGIAEDVMHEAFLTAISKSDSYAGTGSFYGWLRKITINKALMHLKELNRNKFNQELYFREMENIMNEEADSDDIRRAILDAEFDESDLLEAIDSLPVHHRLVFNLYVFDNYSHKMIAHDLNISEGTSKSHLSRARKSLQQILYQKTLKQPLAEKKNKRAALVLFAGSEGFIDKLYFKRLHALTLNPEKPFNGLDASVNWLIVKPLISFKAGFISRINYLVLGSSVILAMFYFIFLNNKVQDNDKPNDRPPNSSSSASVPSEVRTISNQIKQDDLNLDTSRPKKSKQPFIMKKIIYQHVIIHDTVRIIDTTHAS